MQRKAIPFLLFSPLLKFTFPSPLAQMGAPSSAPSPHSVAVAAAWGSQAPLPTAPDTESTVGAPRMSRTAQSSTGTHSAGTQSAQEANLPMQKKKKMASAQRITEALRLEKTSESLSPTTHHHHAHSLSSSLSHM